MNMMNTMTRDTYNLMKLLGKEQVVLSFSGPFSQKLLLTIMDSIKASISDSDSSQSMTNKIFSTVVELTQNIIQYNLDIHAKLRAKLLFSNGIVLIGKTNDGGYYVSSVNVIDTGMNNQICSHLEQIQKMDKADLKKFYYQRIRQDSDKPDSGGVGLITVARNAESFLYDLLVEDDNYSYLFIKAIFK